MLLAFGGTAVAGNGGLQLHLTKLRPATDNVATLGEAGNRWAQLFAGTATINTSDAALKHVRGDLSAAEYDVLLDAIGSIPLIEYQWLDAMAEKGDGARLHYGVIAQQVEAALLAHGLDPWRHAFLCRDPLFETVEEDVKVERPMMRTVDEVVTETVIEGDRAVQRAVTRQTQETATRQIPLYDEAGVRVMTRPSGARVLEDGTEIPAQEPQPVFHFEPVMETVIEKRTAHRPVLDESGEQVVRMGVRYEWLLIMLAAYEPRERLRLLAA